FLLIAAGEPADRLVEIGGDDVELFDERKRGALFLRSGDQAAGSEPAEHLHGHIFAHTQRGKDRLGGTIGAERKDASFERGARRESRHRPAGAYHLPEGFLKAAERAHRFTLAVAFGAGKAEDFAAANI